MLILKLLSGFAIVFALTARQPPGQQPKKLSNGAFLSAKLKATIDHMQSFTDFRQSHSSDSGEYLIVSTFFDAAEAAGEYMYGSLTVVRIYESLSCDTDRTHVQPIVREQLSYYARELDAKIKVIDMGLNASKDGHTLSYYQPAMATAGAELRSDLREFKSFLQSMSL